MDLCVHGVMRRDGDVIEDTVPMEVLQCSGVTVVLQWCYSGVTGVL
jgi:hypothetical protein